MRCEKFVSRIQSPIQAMHLASGVQPVHLESMMQAVPLASVEKAVQSLSVIQSGHLASAAQPVQSTRLVQAALSTLATFCKLSYCSVLLSDDLCPALFSVVLSLHGFVDGEND